MNRILATVEPDRASIRLGSIISGVLIDLSPFDAKCLHRLLEEAAADALVRALQVAVEAKDAQATGRAVADLTRLAADEAGRELVRGACTRVGYDAANVLGVDR